MQRRREPFRTSRAGWRRCWRKGHQGKCGGTGADLDTADSIDHARRGGHKFRQASAHEASRSTSRARDGLRDACRSFVQLHVRHDSGCHRWQAVYLDCSRLSFSLPGWLWMVCKCRCCGTRQPFHHHSCAPRTAGVTKFDRRLKGIENFHWIVATGRFALRLPRPLFSRGCDDGGEVLSLSRKDPAALPDRARPSPASRRRTPPKHGQHQIV